MNKVLNIEDTYNSTSYNITNSEVTVDEFYNNIYNNWGSTKGYEEVFAQGYDTGGNYHWHGVYSGHHVIKKQLGVENEQNTGN